MEHKRIYCFDWGRGLAIFGMLLAHTFEGGICDWNKAAETHYLNRIPVWVIALISPVALICMMGLFFTFITSITCTLNVLRFEKHGKGAVMNYIFYRFVFGAVLKFVERFITSWWETYGIFDTMKIVFPDTELINYGHTLDSIAFCGFLVPLIVYLFRQIPFLKKDWKKQVFALTTFAVILLSAYNYIAEFCCMIGDWAHEYHFNLLYIIMYKIGSGPFMISQALPFGIIGGCIAIILTNQSSGKTLWTYAGIVVSVAISTAIFFLIVTDDPFKEIANERKPCFLRFSELGFEVLVIAFAWHLSDNPARSVVKRYKFMKFVTFLRRLSCVSLTCYIFEGWTSRELRKVFYIFAGDPYDSKTNESLWSFWVVGLFMFINFTLDLFIIKLWEKADFMFSCERMISVILSWLFGKKEEVDWKKKNNAIIYEPLKDLEAEIMATSAECDKFKEITGKENPSNKINDPVIIEMPKRTQIEEQKEIELVSTMIEVQKENM